ncbi:MAG: murein L,D-transpeptidase catalytic domain-containing protein [Bdellovibrionales bacterium]
MTIQKLLPQALILSFCATLIACSQDSSSDPAPVAPDSKIVWPAGPSTLSVDLLNAVIRQGVPQDIATLAFNKYDSFAGRVKNTDYLTIIDFTRHSGKPRLWMVDTKTTHVDALNVAHGAGSDPQGTGIPVKFSNVPDSKTSSLGAYLISEKFQSTKHGTAMRLDGLESTNDLVRDRAIIMHSADYVSASKSIMGMSWGCPAISLEWIARALSRLSGGSFMYAYGSSQMAEPLDELQIQAIMTNPAYQWVNESEDAPVEGVR